MVFRASNRAGKVLEEQFGDALKTITAVTDRHVACLIFMFCELRKEHYYRALESIPCDIDVLIIHRPPFGILDRSAIQYGCPDLLQAVLKIKPKFHLFGHIHDAYGKIQSGETTFIDGSVLDENYRIQNEPLVFCYENFRVQ